MSNKREREKRREERLRAEAEEQVQERRKRLVQLGSGAAFVALVVVVALVVISQSTRAAEGTQTWGTQGWSAVSSGVFRRPALSSATRQRRPPSVEFGDLQCPICKEYSEQVIPTSSSPAR